MTSGALIALDAVIARDRSESVIEPGSKRAKDPLAVAAAKLAENRGLTAARVLRKVEPNELLAGIRVNEPYIRRVDRAEILTALLRAVNRNDKRDPLDVLRQGG